MGVSISGLVIRENLQNRMESFQNCFRHVYPEFKLEFEQEIVFEAMSYKKRRSNHIDFYYTESGTYITFDEIALEGTYWLYKLSEISEFVIFDIHENTMMFIFEKYHEGKRVDFYSFLDNKESGDDFLNIFKIGDMYWKVLPALAKEYIGEDIHAIDQSSKCFRYRVHMEKTQSEIKENHKGHIEVKSAESTEKKIAPAKKGFWNWLKG